MVLINKLYIRRLLLILSLVLLSPIISHAQQKTYPVFFIENDTYDAGEMIEGTDVEHSFTIANKGTDTLLIEKVKPGCSCSAALDFDKEILPGEEGMIKIKVKTSGYNGNVKKYTRVYTNDPANRIVYLGIKLNIKPHISVEPKRAVLRGKVGEVKEKDIIITNNLENPLIIEPVSFNLEGKVSYKLETVKKGKQYRVKFRNSPDAEGRSKGYLLLKTNYEKKRVIRIGITSTFK